MGIMAAEGERDIAEIPENIVVNPPNTASAEEKRKAHNAERGKSRVYLYEQIVPWRDVKSELNFDRDTQLAEFLIARYLSGRNNAMKWYVV